MSQLGRTTLNSRIGEVGSDISAGKRMSPSPCGEEGPGHPPRRGVPCSFDMVDKTGRAVEGHHRVGGRDGEVARWQQDSQTHLDCTKKSDGIEKR